MAVSASFLDYVKELFAPFGAIAVRRMFGGAGVYCDDLFFAIVDDDVIYLKTDGQSGEEFELRGLEPFTFETKDGRIESMSYYSAPGEIFENEDELKRWTSLALDAAMRAARLKKKPARKRTAR